MLLTNRRVALLAWTALTVSAFPACTACSSGPLTSAATLDAGVTDAKRPPKVDAGMDAAIAIPDASDFDAGVNPFVGTWGPVPGAPPECGAKLDLNPQQDIGDLKWIACPSGRPGCRRLVVDWTSDFGVQFAVPYSNVMRVVNGTPYLFYGRVYPKPNSPNFVAAAVGVLTAIDKPAIFATGDYAMSPTACEFNLSVSNTGILAQGLANLAADTPIFFHSSFANPQQVVVTRHAAADLGMVVSGGAIQSWGALGPAMFLGTSNPFSIAVYDPFSDTIRLVKDGITRPDLETPIVTRDGAIAIDGTPTRGFVFVATDASWKKVYLPTPPNEVFGLASDPSQADAFAWLEGQMVGFDYTNVKLFTSPYSTVATQPRKVTSIGSLYNYGGGIIANAGMALVLTDFSTAELVRLSDGWGWSIPAEPGDGFVKPVWVDDNEVWLNVAPAKWQGQYSNGMVRIQRSSLGAPTIPPQ